MARIGIFLKGAKAALLAAMLSACASTGPGPYGGEDGARSNGNPYSDFLVATYAGNTRDARVAASRYMAALEADPSNRMLLERAFIFSVAAGEMDLAAQLAPRLSAAAPDSDLAPLVEGVLALKTGNYQQAHDFFITAHPPGDPDAMARIVLAWTAAGGGDVKTARELLSVTSDAGADAFFAYHRARLEEFLGDGAAADEAYKTADSVTGGRSLTVALAYATWLQATGRAEPAEQVLRKFLETSPGNPVGVSALERVRGGKAIARRIASAQQGAAEGLFGIASALGDDSQDAGIVYLRLAQYLDPENDGALAFLGGALERAKRVDEAIELYLTVPQASPFYVTAQVSAADLMDDNERTDDAIKILRSLEDDESTSGLAASALGDVYRTRERWNDAVDAYGRAIARTGPPFRKDDWPLFYARGISLDRGGRWAEAEKDLKYALELSPDEPSVLNYLAYTWILRGENVQEALAMLHKAVDQRPDDGFVIDSLGWAYYHLGDYKQAVEILEQAVAFAPAEADISEHLGDAYWKVGRRREAQFLWQHALRLNPDKRRIPIIQAKLRDGLEAGEALERQAATEAPPTP